MKELRLERQLWCCHESRKQLRLSKQAHTSCHDSHDKVHLLTFHSLLFSTDHAILRQIKLVRTVKNNTREHHEGSCNHPFLAIHELVIDTLGIFSSPTMLRFQSSNDESGV